MRLKGEVLKSWGHENIFATNDDYCGKLLVFDKEGDKTSMHFHKTKKESWYVLKGAFILRMIDTQLACEHVKVLVEGQSITIDPLQPHQLEAMKDGSTILEVSTADSVEDNYRLHR